MMKKHIILVGTVAIVSLLMAGTSIVIAQETEADAAFPASVIKGAGLDADADDNTMGVLNPVFADYFSEGDTAQGIASIISAGNFSINGIAYPKDADEFAADFSNEYKVNGQVWIKATDDGYSGYSTGFGPMAQDVIQENYIDAAVDSINRISNGYETVLYDDDEDGYADRIETMIYGNIHANEITTNEDGTITISSGSSTRGIDWPERYEQYAGTVEGETIENIDPSFWAEDGNEIEAGNDVMYYDDGDGNRHYIRAAAVTGVLEDSKDHAEYLINGQWYYDAMRFSRNMLVSNRNGGFSMFTDYFKLSGPDRTDDYEVTLWLVPVSEYATSNGAPVGFTTENSKEFLEIAIEAAKAKLAETSSSEDGSDVESGNWIKTAYYDELSDCVAMAEAVLAVEERGTFLDLQSYLLYVTLAGSAGDTSASAMGYDFSGFDNNVSSIYTLVSISGEQDQLLSDEKFNEYFAGGNAEEALKALIADGMIYVNEYQLPAAEDTFMVNGKKAIYPDGDGWAWNVQGYYTGTESSYEDAAFAYVSHLTGLVGQSVNLKAATGSKETSEIHTYVVEVGYVSIAQGNYLAHNLLDEAGEVFAEEDGTPILYAKEYSLPFDCGPGTDEAYTIVYTWKDGTIDGWMSEVAEAEEATVSVEEAAMAAQTWLPEAYSIAANAGNSGAVYRLPVGGGTAYGVELGLTGGAIGYTEEMPVEEEESGFGGF